MSIVTRTGDQGTTGLMYNRRVTKHHPRVEAYGGIDELNAALGLARAAAGRRAWAAHLLAIQRNLVVVMGELATHPADRDRYQRDGFALVQPALTAELDALVATIEPRVGTLRDWAMPGANPAAAALDFARTVCRRAERHVSALHARDELHNPEIIVYLNRLADALWLLARLAEKPGPRRRTR